MRNLLHFLIPMLVLFQSTLAYSQHREVLELKEDWKFTKGKESNAYTIGFDDKSWQTVTIPHDWAIYGPFDKEVDKQVIAIEQNGEKVATEKTGRTGALPYIGEGWYRKRFTLNELEDKRVLIAFDGVMSEAVVYLNGTEVGRANYGYSYFYFDITKLAKEGENLLVVKASNLGKSSRWYPGAGIYRKVRVIIKNNESVDQWGVFVTTPFISKEQAKINLKTKVSGEHIKLVTTIYDPQGIEVGKDESVTNFAGEFEQNIAVSNPQLWSPALPLLYKAESMVYSEGEIVDRLTTRFGIRSINLSPKTGFSLNGETVKLKGVCLHHDLGPIGTAINRAALQRQLRIMKEMGANAIRTAHNMPSIEQLELCDEMGIMVIAESFDEWAVPKVENGYNRFFVADVEKDIVNLVRATRNHPSIIMWSSGNEVPDQWGDEGVKRAKRLQEIFHREDPTRKVTVGMDQVKAVMESGFGALVDVPGLNYRVHLYEEAYKKFPQGFILGSETASTVSSRGIYKFPVEQGIMKQYDDYQSSSYDLEYCSWSNLPEDDFILQDDKPWVLGEFVWTGFDYLGEPTPYDEVWPSRSSYFGLADLAGIPKDRYYLYKSRWDTDEPTLHILPHWNWPGREGKNTPVFVYTSYDSAELFLNGKSQGVRKKTLSGTPQERYRLMWMDVVYEPGELKVVGYDNIGNVGGTVEVKTSGKPYKLVLKADRKEVKADGEDLSFITVSVVDKNGIPCPTATNQLSFSVKGSGVYRASANGDATSLEMFHKPTMKLFSGKLVVLVQANDEPGQIELTVKGKGLKSATLGLNVFEIEAK